MLFLFNRHNRQNRQNRKIGKIGIIGKIGQIGKKVPILANVAPHGTFHMSDLNAIGGVACVMKVLLQNGLLHGDCLTVTGKTVAENLKDVIIPIPGLDSEKCTIGGQNEDSGKFHVSRLPPRHR